MSEWVVEPHTIPVSTAYHHKCSNPPKNRRTKIAMWNWRGINPARAPNWNKRETVVTQKRTWLLLWRIKFGATSNSPLSGRYESLGMNIHGEIQKRYRKILQLRHLNELGVAQKRWFLFLANNSSHSNSDFLKYQRLNNDLEGWYILAEK